MKIISDLKLYKSTNIEDAEPSPKKAFLSLKEATRKLLEAYAKLMILFLLEKFLKKWWKIRQMYFAMHQEL